VHFTLGWTGPEGFRSSGVSGTLAGLSVLAHLSRLAGEKGSDLLVTLASPDIVPVASEIVRQGYTETGNQDSFNPDRILFFGTEQFAYIGGVLGTIAREHIASNVMVGPFAGEALMFAEAAHATGAVQLGGADSVTQTPFFIACCDYALIGEEVFAAGVYLSNDIRQLGSIRGQDTTKIITIIIILIGVALSLMGNKMLINLLSM
jgi:hypothetical protein